MKKVLVLASALALFAAPAFAVGISGTAHDLSDNDAAAGNEICVYCHTPHGAATSVTNAPLWNRSTAAAAGTVYQGVDIDATDMSIAGINSTDAPLCLSCHDGSVGETLQNEPNSGTTNVTAYAFASTAANLSTDMSNDHPVGFNFAAVDTNDTEIQAKGTIEGTAGMTGALSYGSGGDEFWCSSCHDVHNNANAPFLRVSNANSNLCLTCHIK